MIIKSIEWNIGGGKIRDKDDDPVLEDSYKIDGFEYMVNLIKKYSPDVITLIETHANDKTIQAKEIASKLGYEYWVNDIYDHSHLEKGMGLGQAIISKFPINSHNFTFFYNPKFRIIRPNGEEWISHNKGLTSCNVKIGEKELQVMTLHLIPFRKFEIPLDNPEVVKVKDSISDLINIKSKYLLLQGDFNVDDKSLKNFLPKVMLHADEVLLDLPTTPKGRRYDHVIYKGIKFIKSEVVETLTDHYLVYSEFELD